MRINIKTVIFVGAGLLVLFTILGVHAIQSSHDKGTTAVAQPALESGENINESDNGTWLAEYESDGIKAAGGVPATHLPPGKALLPALLLILTGVLAVETEKRPLKQTEQTSDGP